MGKISGFDKFGVEDMEKSKYGSKHAELMEQCLCNDCPSFVKGDSAQAYCFPMIGTSDVIHKENGCSCSTCPVYKEYDLNHSFYCTRCSQVCQSYKAEVGSGHE